MIPLLTLDETIVPGRSLGGLALGTHISEYADLLFEAQSNYEDAEGEDDWRSAFADWRSLFDLWEARFVLGQVYAWSDEEHDRSADWVELPLEGRPPLGEYLPVTPPTVPTIELGVDIRDGIVFALRALAPYAGSLESGVRTGMTGEQALLADERLYYDDTRGAVFLRGVDGVSIQLFPDGWDLESEQVARATVDQIWIFDASRTDSGILATSEGDVEV